MESQGEPDTTDDKTGEANEKPLITAYELVSSYCERRG